MVRNFYGIGHGTWTDFIGMKGKLKQRYRFVFLDGCDSYSGPNFMRFGATEAEVPIQSYDDNSNEMISGCNNKADEIAFYAKTGLRPAAFVGYLTKTIWAKKLDPGQYDDWIIADGSEHVAVYRCIEALGNWHLQFLSLWYGAPGVTPKGILEAKRQADFLAWTLPLQGGGSEFDPSPPPMSQLQVGTDPAGNDIYYSPVNSIKIAGYLELGFNQFNNATYSLPSP